MSSLLCCPHHHIKQNGCPYCDVVAKSVDYTGMPNPQGLVQLTRSEVGGYTVGNLCPIHNYSLPCNWCAVQQSALVQFNPVPLPQSPLPSYPSIMENVQRQRFFVTGKELKKKKLLLLK